LIRRATIGHDPCEYPRNAYCALFRAPWNVRGGSGPDAGGLTDFLGTELSWQRTEAERRRTADPRPRIEGPDAGKRENLRTSRAYSIMPSVTGTGS
jgi:hypothetical protein